MANPNDRRSPEGKSSPIKAPFRSPFAGIVGTIFVVVLALAAIAFIASTFDSEDLGAEPENAALEAR